MGADSNTGSYCKQVQVPVFVVNENWYENPITEVIVNGYRFPYFSHVLTGKTNQLLI